MGLVFRQQYSAGSGVYDQCMPPGSEMPSPTTNGRRWFAFVGGSGSAAGQTVTLDGGTVDGRNQPTVQCLLQWHAFGDELAGITEFQAGDWICRFSVAEANSAIYWDKVQICALKDGVLTTVALKTGINLFLAATGTKTTTITTTSPTTVAAGSQIVWGFHFGKSETLSAESAKIRSNKNLATPIEHVVAVTVIGLTGSPILPGTTIGGISISSPVVPLLGVSRPPAVGVEYTPLVATGSFSTTNTGGFIGETNFTPPVLYLDTATIDPIATPLPVHPPATPLTSALFTPTVAADATAFTPTVAGITAAATNTGSATGGLSVDAPVVGIGRAIWTPGTAISDLNLAVEEIEVEVTAQPPIGNRVNVLPELLYAIWQIPSVSFGGLPVTAPVVAIGSATLTPGITFSDLDLAVAANGVGVTALPTVNDYINVLPELLYAIWQIPSVAFDGLSVTVPAVSLATTTYVPKFNRYFAIPAIALTTDATSRTVKTDGMSIEPLAASVDVDTTNTGGALGGLSVTVPVVVIGRTIWTPGTVISDLDLAVEANEMEVSALPSINSYVNVLPELLYAITQSPSVSFGGLSMEPPALYITAAIFQPNYPLWFDLPVLALTTTASTRTVKTDGIVIEPLVASVDTTATNTGGALGGISVDVPVVVIGRTIWMPGTVISDLDSVAPAVALATSVIIPAFTGDGTVTPPVASVDVDTTNTAVAVGGISIAPPVIALTSTAYSRTVKTDGMTIEPAVVSLDAVSTSAGSTTDGVTVSPPVAALATAVPLPTNNRSFDPPVIGLTAAAMIPGAVIGSITFGAPTASLFWEVLAPVDDGPQPTPTSGFGTARGAIASSAPMTAYSGIGSSASEGVSIGSSMYESAAAIASGGIRQTCQGATCDRSTQSSAGLDRMTTNTAISEAANISASSYLHAELSRSGVESGSASFAMESRFLLVCGGPEAFSLGSG